MAQDVSNMLTKDKNHAGGERRAKVYLRLALSCKRTWKLNLDDVPNI